MDFDKKEFYGICLCDHSLSCYKFMSSSVCTNLDFAANLILDGLAYSVKI